MDNLRGQLVLQAWYNGKWNVVDHGNDTVEELKRLESLYHSKEYEDYSYMRIEKFY